METVARTFLIISVTVFCVLGAQVLYQQTQTYSFDAFAPRHDDIMIFVPTWREAATEVATSSATSTID